MMNILLVEDDEAVADVLMRALKKWGQKAVWVTSRTEAVSRVQETNFDLVLLDIMLPDGLGYEIIPEIKRFQPETNIITLTGNNSPQLERTVRGYGIAYYMSKPINLPELKQIINHFLSKQNHEAA